MKNFYEKMSASYALSKTLRFELLPIGMTRSNLEKHEILIKDAKKDKAYHEIKPLFDEIHDKFISESLEKSEISWNEYFEEIQKSNPDKEILKKIEKDLRNEIGKLFETTGNTWRKSFNDEIGEEILKQK